MILCRQVAAKAYFTFLSFLKSCTYKFIVQEISSSPIQRVAYQNKQANKENDHNNKNKTKQQQQQQPIKAQ